MTENQSKELYMAWKCCRATYEGWHWSIVPNVCMFCSRNLWEYLFEGMTPIQYEAQWRKDGCKWVEEGAVPADVRARETDDPSLN